MYPSFTIPLTVCVSLLASTAYGQNMASKITKHFPGKWEYKRADGTRQGTVEWELVAGGKSVAGKGESDLGKSYVLAGWDPARDVWIHTSFAENGQYVRLEVTKCKGDTYHGTVHRVDSNGEPSSSKWKCEIIGQDHFEITETTEDAVTVTHWHRRKEQCLPTT